MNARRTIAFAFIVALAVPPAPGVAQTARPGGAPATAADLPPMPKAMDQVMALYCAAPGHNPFWCGAREGLPTIPLAQQWEIVDGYCFDRVDYRIRPDPPDRRKVADAAADVCDALAKVPIPLAVIYNPETQRWKPNGAFEAGDRKHDFDPDDATGKPTLYLDKDEAVGVVIENLNPLAYRVERGETIEKQVPGFESIQTVLTAAGGALSAFAATVALHSPEDPQDLRLEAAALITGLEIRGTPVAQQAFTLKLEAAAQALRNEFAFDDLAVTKELSGEKLDEASRAELARIEALIKQAEAARRLQEQRRLDSEAFDSDRDALQRAAARLKTPFNALRSGIDRLERQLRRLISSGRQLNGGVTSIGRSFDEDIERQATWSKLFDDLRSAQLETDREIGVCSTALDKFSPVVTTDPSKATDVHSAAIDFLKEFDPQPAAAAGVARTCALTALMPRLTDSVITVQAEAARLARVAKVDENAALPLRLAQADARERFLEITRVLSRHIAEFVKLKDETPKIFEKEAAVKKQAELSKMLSDRARNASMRAFGSESAVTCADMPSGVARSMSLQLVTPHPKQLPMRVRLTLHKGGSTTPIDALIPGHAGAGELVPIGVSDVDFFEGCKSIDSITVGSGSETAPVSSVDVRAHQGFVLTNRVFVHERVFAGSLSKIWTEKVVMTLAQPEDQLIVSAPNKLETTYDLARRSGQLFGANIGVIYTPLVSRTFSLVDPTPESTTTVKETLPGPPVTETVTPEQNRVTEKDRQTKAGQLAAFLNVHAAKRHWLVKPGFQIGFGLDTDSPSVLLGLSLEVTKYLRFGGGPAWIQAEDIRDVSLLDDAARVPNSFEIPTENKFRPTWYFSFSFAIDSLPMFSKN